MPCNFNTSMQLVMLKGLSGVPFGLQSTSHGQNWTTVMPESDLLITSIITVRIG